MELDIKLNKLGSWIIQLDLLGSYGIYSVPKSPWYPSRKGLNPAVGRPPGNNLSIPAGNRGRDRKNR